MKLFRRIFRKFSHSIKGVSFSFKEEKSITTHFVIGALIIPVGIYAELTLIEWSLIAIVIGLVIGMELMNTAVENLVDLFEFKYNTKAGKIKDIGAAATLIVALSAIIVGILILGPAVIEKAGA